MTQSQQQAPVAVPVSELARLEQARLEIYELLGAADTATLVKWSHVTEVMWEIANRKWPAVEEPVRLPGSMDMRDRFGMCAHPINSGVAERTTK